MVPVVSKLCAVAVAATMWAAMSVAAPAAAADKGDGAAPVAAQARKAGKAAFSQRITMPATAKNGLATSITCYVNGFGPNLTGNYAGWTIIINCVGGTPTYLSVYMDIARYTGPYSYVIEAANACERHSDVVLTCAVVTPCFQAGGEYDGYADLYGIDEFGQLHQSWFGVPRTWVGCLV